MSGGTARMFVRATATGKVSVAGLNFPHSSEGPFPCERRLCDQGTGIPCAYANGMRLYSRLAGDRHRLDYAGLDGVSGEDAWMESSDVLQISPSDPAGTNA